MRVFASWSIRSRLYGSTLFCLAMLLVTGAAGFVALESSRTTVQEVFAKRVQTLTDMSELRTNLGEVLLAEKNAILNASNVLVVQEMRERWATTVQGLGEKMQMLGLTQDDGSSYAQALAQAREGLVAYAEGMRPILQQVEDAQIDGSGATAYAEQRKGPVVAADRLLAESVMQAQNDMEQGKQAIEAQALQMKGLIAAVVLLAVLVMLPVTVLSVRTTLRSLEQARVLAERIAAGDLSQDLPAARSDEVGQLVASMGRMQQALRSLVAQVQAAAGEVTTASSEIASGNHHLSERTEHTASYLQHTTDAMHSLGLGVQHTAESAVQAKNQAQAAAQVASRGGAVVGDVVATMEQIAHSAHRITDITGVIDGIAFQTNILALNAAVEAARAGEQGRGFAVVASEVRSLAQRSADAAKEIKGLIATSVERVEAGTALVGRAGATMGEIVGSVDRVAQLIAEITEAAASQHRQIGAVSTSVGELEQMTQQNAALVEESTAASAALRDQAQALEAAVRRFAMPGQEVVQAETPQRLPAAVTAAATAPERVPASASALAPVRPALPPTEPAQAVVHAPERLAA